MDVQAVNTFLQVNADNFPIGAFPMLRERMLAADESKVLLISYLNFKSPLVALLLSLFGGCLGIDRFYIGDIALGFCKLLTCGGFGIWTMIDWFLIWDTTKRNNLNKLLLVL